MPTCSLRERSSVAPASATEPPAPSNEATAPRTTPRRLRLGLVFALLGLPGALLLACGTRADPAPFPWADGSGDDRSVRGPEGDPTLQADATGDLLDAVCEPTWRTCPNGPPRTPAQIEEGIRQCRAFYGLPCLAEALSYTACVKPYARCDDAGQVDLYPPNNPCPIRATDASVSCEDGGCRCN